ncbi:MAG: phosphate ABC transporter substrate-binding protein [Deltaproteobacteria bacterium]|jgi:phosphate transport system substrate-binding protein|nr:MAG: phosphate ABC transporter substrate-binding protein [Deltaproteobacteria bacterium]
MHNKMVLSFCLVATLLLGAGYGCNSNAQETIKVDGSSTVYPITEAVAEEFQIAKKGKVRVTVGISGTGGGFKKFCRGETDISNASRPIRKIEMEACSQNGIKYIELPVAFDGLSVVVNPQNSWVDCMSVEELKKIWEPEAQGKIKKWNQVRPQWPDADLKLCGAGVDSGTYDYFTEAIVGKEHSSRGDYTASEDDNVLVQFAANEKNALCFFGFAYYEENKDKLKAVPIKSPVDGNCYLPSAQNVENGKYQPLSRPLFIYVNAESLAKKPEVREFVEFYITHAKELVPEVGYIALPEKVYRLALERVKAGKTGTVFAGGSEVGVSIEEIVKRETTE